MQKEDGMNFLSLVLIAGAVFISHPVLAQTVPAEPSPSSTRSASEGTNPASSTPTGVTAAETKPTRQVMVSALTGKDLKGSNDTELGDIERVVENETDKKTYVVVSRGGFLGLFEKEYLVPVDQIALSGNADVTVNLTPTQLESSAPFTDNTATYRSLDDTQMVAILEKR
jgi:hypothetical protein